jgi:DNA-binding XRE family transcriptional regulator
MNEKPPKAERVMRELTTREQKMLEAARAETLAQKELIVAQGLAYKAARLLVREQWLTTIGKLKTKRERLGLSLADVEALTGLKRSALSRLENDVDANPTLLTIQRYAMALGITLSTVLKNQSVESHSRPPGNARESA